MQAEELGGEWRGGEEGLGRCCDRSTGPGRTIGWTRRKRLGPDAGEDRRRTGPGNLQLGRRNPSARLSLCFVICAGVQMMNWPAGWGRGGAVGEGRSSGKTGRTPERLARGPRPGCQPPDLWEKNGSRVQAGPADYDSTRFRYSARISRIYCICRIIIHISSRRIV